MRGQRKERAELESEPERGGASKLPATSASASTAEAEYSYRDRIEPTIDYLYRPRTLSVLAAVLLGMTYMALTQTTEHSSPTNSARFPRAAGRPLMLRGIMAAVVVFVLYGVTQLRDGPFIRPHPVFWRAVQALSVVYLVFLVYLFFQSVSDARQLISFVDPALGVPLPERSYANNCRIEWSSLREKMDIFIVAHVFGWYAKALILRDNWLCWIISVMFEVMEYSLEHQLPNFGECWWDHWILDVLVCNWLGIWAGMKTCQYFAMKTYNWRSIKHIPDVPGKVRRTMAQFTPHSWVSFNWAATKSLKGYLIVLAVTFFFLASELNAFYLKYLLWVPPEHYLNVVRIALHAFNGAVATRETYQYCTDPKCKRIGAQAWLIAAIIVTESLISFKFGRNQFPAPAPMAVIYFWIGLTILLVLFPLWQFYLSPRLYPPATTSAAAKPARRTASKRH